MNGGKQSHPWTPSARYCVAGVLVTLPTVVAAAIWPQFIGISWFFGMWASLYLMLKGDHLVVLVAKCLGLAVLGMGASLLHPYPFLGGLFVAVVAGAAACAIRWGTNSAYRIISIVVSLTVVAPAVQFHSLSRFTNTAWIGLMMVAGSLWTVLCWKLVLGGQIPNVKQRPASRRTTASFALVVGIAMGLTTWVILTWWPEYVAGWTMITVIVIIQADQTETLSLGEKRIAGTLVGLAIALLLSPIANYAILATAFGTLLFLYAYWWLIVAKRSYRVSVALLTSAVVILDSPPAHVDLIALDRLVFTLVGVAVALLSVGIIHWLIRNEPKSEIASS